MKKRSVKSDILLIAGLVLAGLILLAVLFITRRSGGTVQVRIDGKVTAEYSLNENRTETFECGDGGTNVLKIENGEAWMEDASCPDKLCVKTGHISYKGQSVICLPNKVVLEITSGSEKESTPDVISGGRN